MEKNYLTSIVKLLYQLYKRIEIGIQQSGTVFFYSIVLFLKRRCLFRVKDLYLSAYLVQGKEKHSKEKMNVLFCGDKNSLKYISNFLFSDDPNIKYIGRYPIWKLAKIYSTLSKDVDVIIFKTDRFLSKFLQKKGFITLPAWINMKLDITKSLEEISKNFKKSAKEDIRRIERHGYSYEVTDDPKKFDEFYYNLRQPYFIKRIGEQALPGSTSYFEVKNGFESGKLFLIKDGDKYISGFIIINHRKETNPHFMGILESPYLDEGAGSALFYNFITWAKRHDIKILNFGHTRTFLNEGAFRFKRKWGMTAEIDRSFFGMFAFKFNNFKTRAVYEFFEKNPFLYIDKNKLKGFVFSHNQVNSDEIRKIYKRYYTPGMKELTVIFSRQKLEGLLKNFNGRIDGNVVRITPDNLPKKSKDEEQVRHIIPKEYEELFKSLVIQFPNLKNNIAHTFTNTLPRFKKKNIDITRVDEQMFKAVFSAVKEGKYSKEGVPSILEYLLQTNTYNVEKAIHACNLSVISKSEIEGIINCIISEKIEYVKQHGPESFYSLMGIAMKELKGKADEKIVRSILQNKIEEVLETK